MANYSVYFTPEDESYGCRDMTEEEKQLTDKYFRQIKAWKAFSDVLPRDIEKIIWSDDVFEVAKEMVRMHTTPDEHLGLQFFKKAAERYYDEKMHYITQVTEYPEQYSELKSRLIWGKLFL